MTTDQKKTTAGPVTGPAVALAHAPVSGTGPDRTGEVVGAEREHLAGGFGARIRSYRKAAHMTQAALAKRAGVSASTIRGYEQGRRRPGETTVAALAAVLDYRHPLDVAADLRALAGGSWRQGRQWSKGTPPQHLRPAVARKTLRQAQDDLTAAEKLARQYPTPGMRVYADEARQRVSNAREDVARADALAARTTQ